MSGGAQYNRKEYISYEHIVSYFMAVDVLNYRNYPFISIKNTHTCAGETHDAVSDHQQHGKKKRKETQGGRNLI